MAKQSHSTQWAAQFAVASELCKRGYQVALTLGNHPSVDLMVCSPSGVNFDVDVKGLYKKNYFLLKPKAERKLLFYVLAYVPAGASNEFFILSQSDAKSEVDDDIERTLRRRKLTREMAQKVGSMPGISWKAVQRYKDRWQSLPI